MKNGVEVRRTTAPVKVKARVDRDPEKEWTAPAGSYHVSLAQPAARLARSLLDPHFDMGEDVRKREMDRKARRLDDEIYDLTAWSLPTAFGVTALAVAREVPIPSTPTPCRRPPAASSAPSGRRSATSSPPRTTRPCDSSPG